MLKTILNMVFYLLANNAKSGIIILKEVIYVRKQI